MLFFLLFSSSSPQTPKGTKGKKKITKKNSPTKKSPTKAELQAKLENSDLAKDKVQLCVAAFHRGGKKENQWGPTLAIVKQIWEATYKKPLLPRTAKKELVDSGKYNIMGIGAGRRFTLIAA